MCKHCNQTLLLAALCWVWALVFVDISSNHNENGPSTIRVRSSSKASNTSTRNAWNSSNRQSKQRKDQGTKIFLIEADTALDDKRYIWRPTGKDIKGADSDKMWLIYAYFSLCEGRIFAHLQKSVFPKIEHQENWNFHELLFPFSAVLL